MRLDVLERGHRLPARLFIRIAQLVTRQRMDNVVLTLLHRPELWGRPFAAVLRAVMRGPSYWTVGEREYLAAAVSRANECPFCIRAHTETTRLGTTGEVAIDDPSVMRPELAAVVRLLEQLTTDPDSIGPGDLDAVRAAGVPDDAIVDALHVAFVFNSVNRMANAFGWTWSSEAHVQTAAKVIDRTGYRLPGIVLR